MNTEMMLLAKMVFLLKKLFPVFLIISLFFFGAFAFLTSMFCANLQDPKYRYQVEKYKEVLSVECGCFDLCDRVMQLLNSENLFEVLHGIWLTDDIKL